MPSFQQTILLHHDLHNIYLLISDVESYPSFLPWCESVNIIKKDNDNVIAEMCIKFCGLHEKYTSSITLKEPSNNTANISVTMVTGPFKYLNTEWRLISLHNGTKVDFAIDFQFQSNALEKLAQLVFKRVCEKIMQAFISRACTITA